MVDRFVTGISGAMFTGYWISLPGDSPAARTAFWLGYAAAKYGSVSLPVVAFVCPKCGVCTHYGNAVDVPIVDTPCPSGCSDVWVVRYAEWMESVNSGGSFDGNPA